MPAQKERPQVPHPGHGNADVLTRTAKARQSEQGALKRGGIDLPGHAAEVERQIAALAGLQRRPVRRSLERRNPRAQRRPVTRFGKTA